MTDTQTSSLLSIKDLMVQYPTDEGVVKALDGVSLDIAPGQTLGVVGESGCGKSTVGRAILQILDRPGRVVGGEILWDARGDGRRDPGPGRSRNPTVRRCGRSAAATSPWCSRSR